MPTLAIVAEMDPITGHLVLLIIAVASAGALLLIILLATILLGGARRDHADPSHESKRTKAVEPSQNPFGDSD